MSLNKLLSILNERVLIFDGAMGTLIVDELGRFDYPVELVNLEFPDIPYEIHSAYVESGADIITTNTFGASNVKLKQYGLEKEFERINREAVRIAKDASKGKALVAGDIGPLGEFLIPFGKTTPQEAFAAFYKQAKVLVESGVDLIIIETMVDILEIKLAIMAVSEAAKIPLIITASFYDDMRTVTGSKPENIAITLSPYSPFALGANCGGDPNQLPEIVREFSVYTDR
ncbi:MAG: homocysteine S-methyltransferase family protein, partial [bacterium]